MTPFSAGLVLLALASIASSKPLSPLTSQNDRTNRYNPVRMIMDVLCTNFETSFCLGTISPAITNRIVPETSDRAPRAIPALCEPSNFMDYRNYVDKRPSRRISETSGTKQDCCLTCYDRGNCLSWAFTPSSLQCSYYVATSLGRDGGESDVCPLGVDRASYEEISGYPAMLGSGFGHNYGPCLGDAPLEDGEANVGGDASKKNSQRYVNDL